MSILFSASTLGFYPSQYPDGPTDLVEITDEDHARLLAGQSEGYRIVADRVGRPVLAEPLPPEPLTKEQIEALRLRAYSCPLTGSDRHFSEAARLEAVGDQVKASAARATGIARYNEIKAIYPWSEASKNE